MLGRAPTAKCRTTLNVRGSISSTLSLSAVRHVDQRTVVSDDRAERAGRIGCVDVRRRECLGREGNAAGTPGRHQLADRGRRACLAAPAGDQDSAARAHSREVREGSASAPAAAESAARWIDRGDARSRRAHDGAAAAGSRQAIPRNVAAAAWVVGAGNRPIARTRPWAGSNDSTVRVAFPLGVEPPAISSLPRAAVTAA